MFFLSMIGACAGLATLFSGTLALIVTIEARKLWDKIQAKRRS